MGARRKTWGAEESRTLVLDVLHFSRNVPRFSVDRVFHLRPLERLRRQAPVRISWPVLFAKAHALTALEIPPLRCCYVPWPIPRLIEFPTSVATVAVNRRWRQQNRLFWTCLQDLESSSLARLQQELARHQEAPLEEVFSKQLRFSRLPFWMRRPIWWYRLHCADRQRPRRFGTFAISVLAGQGAYNRNFPHFLTAGLTYGPLDREGSLLVTLICDHRVLDGMTAATALSRLEETLLGTVHQELSAITHGHSAAA